MPDTALIETLRHALARADGSLVCAYLFGSRARGNARMDSDVDVAVLFEPPPPRTLAGMRLDVAALIEECVRRPVDLVVLNYAAPDLVHRVLRDGVILLDRDRKARIRLEVKLRNEYFDMQPIRARYRAGSRLARP